MAIGIALIGGGIWAKEEHLPAIEASKTLALKAIYSRTRNSAEMLGDIASSQPDLYSEDYGDLGFTELLKRADIEALIISLPIKIQMKYIRQALLAGKHVLSEKPVCENLEEAREMIKWYRSSINGPTWCVAENWRYLESYEFAKQQIESLGKITGFHGSQYAFIEEHWKFNLTEWRKNPTHQGGYLLDGGVHYFAALRKLLSSQAGSEIVRVAAFTNQQLEYLPPVDTASVILQSKAGISGTFTISVATSLRANVWLVACERGWIRVEDSRVTINKDGIESVLQIPNERTGVPPEIRAWGEALVRGIENKQQSPEEALGDLELLELVLRSGENQGMSLTCAHQVPSYSI